MKSTVLSVTLKWVIYIGDDVDFITRMALVNNHLTLGAAWVRLLSKREFCNTTAAFWKLPPPKKKKKHTEK